MSFTFLRAAENSSTSDPDAQYDASVPAGALLVACARSSAGTSTGFSDGTNGAWTAYVVGPDADGNTFTYGYVLSNSGAGQHVVAITGSGVGNLYLSIAAYSYGAITATELTKNNRDVDDNDATANSGAVTVPAADAIAIGLGICGGSARTFSAGGTGTGTWLQRSTGSAWRACIQDIIDVGTGSAESAPNISGGNSPNQGAIIIIGEATAGATTQLLSQLGTMGMNTLSGGFK